MRLLGLVADLALRAALLGLLRRIRSAPPDDPRFVGKGIQPRAALLVPIAQLGVPLAWLRRGGPYPFWVDSLFVSVVALDLAGNLFDLYDRYRHFDLIPHAHGAGAMTVVATWAFDVPVWSGIGVATVGHTLLEVQEYASDVAFGYRNVRGTWDVIGDLGSGLVGTAVYGAAYARTRRDRSGVRTIPAP